MRRGNPESADAVIARDSRVFIADKLSDMNKKQLTNRKLNGSNFALIRVFKNSKRY